MHNSIEDSDVFLNLKFNQQLHKPKRNISIKA